MQQVLVGNRTLSGGLARQVRKPGLLYIAWTALVQPHGEQARVSQRPIVRLLLCFAQHWNFQEGQSRAVHGPLQHPQIIQTDALAG